MELKTMQEFLLLQRQAEGQGKPLSQVLEEEIKLEEKRQADIVKSSVRVQIMPHNVVGGYGKFPAICFMPESKAVELAHLGTVKILMDANDEVKIEDDAAIEEHTDEMMAIRKSREKLPKVDPRVKPARLTNVVAFEKERERKEKAKKGSDVPGAESAEGACEGAQEEMQAREPRRSAKG